MSAAVVCLQTSSVTNNILQPPANLTKIRNAKIFIYMPIAGGSLSWSPRHLRHRILVCLRPIALLRELTTYLQ